MTAIGARDTLIILQRYTAVQDEYGEEVPTWADLGSEFAAVYYGRGDERRQAAREEGGQTASFVVLANNLTRGLALRDRISLDGYDWDIRGISPDTPTRGEIELSARRAL